MQENRLLNLLRHHVTGAIERGEGSAVVGIPAVAWLSSATGRWHAAARQDPSWLRDEATMCGVTVRPVNVTALGERPPTHPRNLCKRCSARVGAP